MSILGTAIGLQFALPRRANVKIEGIAQTQAVDDEICQFVGYNRPLICLAHKRRALEQIAADEGSEKKSEQVEPT